MKRFFLLTAAALAAVMVNAEVISIDLNSASEMAFTGCSANFSATDNILTVNYTAGGWQWAGVEFPLDNLAAVTTIRYDYKGDGAEGFDEGIVLYVYLRDSEGNRWIQYDYWPNLRNKEWQTEAIVPDSALNWDAPSYKLGDKPFTNIGFIANPGAATSGSFQLRNIKITATSGGGGEPSGEDGKVLPLTFNGEVLPESSAFSRSMCGTVRTTLDLAEVSGIACSRVTPGYIWMQSDECDKDPETGKKIHDHIIATDEKGKDLYMRLDFRTLKANGIRYYDWEDMCGGVYNGKNYLFVGAFGDNDEVDDYYTIVYFEEPAIDPENTQMNITPAQIEYQYPDGKSHNAEAIMYDNIEQKIYIITKVYYNVAKVYSIPFRLDYGDEVQTLTYVCDLGVTSDIELGEYEDGTMLRCKGFHLVTAADISPDGKYVLIKNHNNIKGFADYSWILYWERRDDESIAQTVQRQPVVLDCYEHEWQGEAICWLDDNTFYTTSDSDGEPPIYKYVRNIQPTDLGSIESTEPTARLMLIGNILYISHPQGLYTIDGRKIQ